MEIPQHVRKKADGSFKLLRQNPLVSEGAPIVGLYWLYTLIRWFVARDSTYEAFDNAFKIVHIERQIGVFFEPVIQKGAIDHALDAVHFANLFYTVGYFPVLVFVGILLFRFDRTRFHTFKLAFLLGLAFALICYSLFPLAPPRMLPQLGFVDTQKVFGSNLYNHKLVVSLYNPYAAMPSLHFGCALLVGMMAVNLGRKTLKAVGVLYPSCMALVIVMSGHHYILDIVGGGVVFILAYSLARAFPSAKRRLVPMAVGVSYFPATTRRGEDTKKT